MFAAPLVCFCDLPLSLIRKHISEYGDYGIGLTKQWGIKNGLSPIIYTHKTAQTWPPILRLSANAEKNNDKTVANDLMRLAAYTKPISGAAWRNNVVEPKVHFYDEREWRYVPVVRGGEPLFLRRGGYTNAHKTNTLNKRLKAKYALPIHPDDVQYLIVPDDKQERHVLSLAKYIKGLYGHNNAVLVTTTIMSFDCIQEDV
jgi:hypothetical protein